MGALAVRRMVSEDAEAVAALSGVLGHAITAEDVRRRLNVLTSLSAQALFVAVDSGMVIGWVHAYGVPRLQTDGYVEIGGIAVSESHRRRGIGARLVRECEQWGRTGGFSKLRLRSGLHREGAHLFYQRIGYKQGRASYAFERALIVEKDENAV
jgi:GNAT superfamily N-acetyltransferase